MVEPTINKEATPEEVAEQHKKLSEYYESIIPLLTKQLEYEKLRTHIATEKAKCKQAEIAFATMGAPDPKATKPEDLKKA